MFLPFCLGFLFALLVVAPLESRLWLGSVGWWEGKEVEVVLVMGDGEMESEECVDGGGGLLPN
jgi:hypothetical protein